MGNAYIKLAKEEPHLFKIFILHERKGISSFDDLYQTETNADIAGFIAENLCIKKQQAKQLHLHMLIYTIGLGAIFSITSPGIPIDEIFAQQETAFDAFLKQILENREDLKYE